MPKLDDNKTDSLFQVGAGRHDFEYEPAAWEQMEILLDSDEAARRRRFLWFLDMIVMLLLALFTFGYPFGGSEELKTEPILTEQDGNQERPPATAAPEHMEDGGKVETVDNDATTVEKNTSSSKENASDTAPSDGNSANKQKEDIPSSATQKSVEEGTSASKSKSSGIVTQRIQSDQSNKIDNVPSVAPAPSLPEHLKRKAPAIRQRTDKLVILLPQLPISLLTFEENLPELNILPVKSATTLDVKAPLISVGVSAGLVFGSVESSGFKANRSRFGTKVNYRLGKKFSIGTGAYLNQVFYKADGVDYKAEEEIWTDGIEPESIQAECNVLEIPLSLTYFSRGSNKSGLYAAAGLTSYFMMKEVFTFNYDSPRDDLIKGWKEENTNRHLLGIGHFNLGYQRKSGQRSAFQIESFIHLPLQGIGHGNVNLITAGASVNYTFGLKRKK